MKRQLILRIIFVILALKGLAISGVLAYNYLNDTPVPCTVSIFSGCEVVQESKYAQIAGVPIPLFGLGFYLLILIDQLLLFNWHRTRPRWDKFVWGLAGLGFLFSLYLTSLEAFVIHAWCIWCVGSALITTIIFLLMSWDKLRPTPSRDGATP